MSGRNDGFTRIRDGADEPILDPDMPIIDTLHHLFDRGALRFMLEDYLACAAMGHRILATVYVETQAMARRDRPAALRPLGEVEFATGMAAMAASGVYGGCRVAAGIIGHADMTLGEEIAPLLDRAMAISPERFRGVRQIALAHPDPNVLRFLTNKPPADLLKHPNFPASLKLLAQRELSFEATVLHHQLPELAEVVAQAAQTRFVLSHMGLATAPGIGPEARAEVFEVWRGNKAPPEKGGWNLFSTFTSGYGLGANPFFYWGHSAVGEKAGFGWPENPDHEMLRAQWAAAGSLAERQAIARKMQSAAWEWIPYVTYGRWLQPVAYRKNTKGWLKSPEIVPFWNVEKS